jgi:hypothetical protein
MAMKNYRLLGVGLNLAAALTLVACATAAEKAPVQDRIVYVDRPVATQPIKPEQVPPIVAPLGPRPPTIRQMADRALGGFCEAIAYVLKADPLLRISAGEEPRALPLYPECDRH